ncbi:MAG: hypothetical protein JO363_21015 [Solirubrobacterales bacterium]|nr:hypothetical protein [Solirubrobacterales bacterium]
MPTLQSSSHRPRHLRMRLGAGLVALGALIAIGATALLMAVASAGHAGTVTAAVHQAPPSAQTRTVAVIPADFSFLRDPTTHALERVRTTAGNGWPTLESVLAPLTPQQREYVMGIASLSYAQLAAAFGTGT